MISATNFFGLPAGSAEVCTFVAEVAAAAAAPGDWVRDSSLDAPYATTRAHPAAGTLLMAPRPFGMSANFMPAVGDW
jgi:hypothetical protein